MIEVVIFLDVYNLYRKLNYHIFFYGNHFLNILYFIIRTLQTLLLRIVEFLPKTKNVGQTIFQYSIKIYSIHSSGYNDSKLSLCSLKFIDVIKYSGSHKQVRRCRTAIRDIYLLYLLDNRSGFSAMCIEA